MVERGLAVAFSPSDTSVGISEAANKDARHGGESELRIQQLLRAVDFYQAVLAMASHDLRQPLQTVISAHELLARRLADRTEREHLERGEQAAAQLAEKLDQLVDALQLLQRTSRIEPEPVPLEPVLQRLMQQLADPAWRKGVALRVVPTQAVVMSQAALLEGMLRNLARNALDHTMPGGRVLIGCRQRGTAFRIEVRDNGEGIPSDKLMTVFEPFFRLDATRSDGLGLGLFIVKRAANCLGHRIEVRSAPYRGSCFAVLAQAADGPAIDTTMAEIIDGIARTR
jgi:signal transduction histidine kinase